MFWNMRELCKRQDLESTHYLLQFIITEFRKGSIKCYNFSNASSFLMGFIGLLMNTVIYKMKDYSLSSVNLSAEQESVPISTMYCASYWLYYVLDCLKQTKNKEQSFLTCERAKVLYRCILFIDTLKYFIVTLIK